MGRNRDMYVAILFMVFVTSFPFYLFIGDLLLIKILQILANFILSVLLFFYVKFPDVVRREHHRTNFKVLPYFIPAALACFSNFFVLIFTPHTFVHNANIYLDIIFAVVIVFNEEIIFRLLMQNSFGYYSPLRRIVTTSLIFAAFHIISFISTLDPFELLRVIYAFGLGMILGLIYEYSRNILAPIIFHFAFNFFNQVIFNCIAIFLNPIYYIVVNMAVALVVLIYLAIIYKVKLSKLD